MDKLGLLRFFKKNLIIILIFAVIFFVFGFYAKDLGLYTDDNVMIFPVVLKAHVSHFIQFNYDQGFSRPFALVYFYIIYTIYLLLPLLAHVFLVFFHILNALLLFYTLKKYGFNRTTALFCSLVFATSPFGTELFLYLALIHGIIVIFFFLIQLLLLKSRLSFNKKLLLIFLLSLISVFSYELTFFLFIPIGISLYLNSEKKTSLVLIEFILAIPNALYFIFSRIIFPPHILNPRAPTLSLTIFLNNFFSFLKNINFMFFTTKVWDNFWLLNFKDGISFINEASIIKILILLLVALFVFYLLTIKKDSVNKQENQICFWWMVFVSSLPPLFFVEGFNFPFRAIYLPSILFFIALIATLSNFFVKMSNNRLFVFSIFVLVTFFFIIDIGIAIKYKKQITIDDYLTKNIKTVVIASGFSDLKPAYLIINNVQHSMVYNDFLQADHILSCYNYYWCAQASLNMITGVIKDIGIYFTDGSFSSKSELPYNKFLIQRPLVILEYSKSNGLKTIKVIK